MALFGPKKGKKMALFGLFGWFRRRRRERERAIFHYFDGLHERTADPLAALLAMRSDEKFDLETHGTLVDAGDLEAIEIAAGAMRRVFDLPPFEHGGPTNAECVSLLYDFVEFLDALKKNGNGSVTTPPPTDFTLSPFSDLVTAGETINSPMSAS